MKRSFVVVLISASIFLACDRMPKLGPGNEDENKLASASQEACGFVQNSFGQRVSWKRSLPIKMYLDPTFPPEYEATLREAAQKWEEVLQRSLFVFERSTEKSTQARDSRNVIYWKDLWDVANEKLQAVSSLSWYRNQLLEADLQINHQHFSYYTEAPQSGQDVHLTSLLVHELGHILGLNHVKEKSVMITVLDYLLKRDLPTEEDKAHIRCEYN